MNSRPLRRSAFRPISSVFAALLLAGATRAAESAPADTMPVNVPVFSGDTMVQQQLQSLDQLLAADPKVADTLAANPAQTELPAFRASNPAWDAYLKRHPNALAALRAERHFLLHRTVAQLAHRPMMRADFAQLDAFLDAHPDIAKPLDRQPRLIADSNFLVAHPDLATFLEKHPALSTLVLQRADRHKGAPKPAPVEK